VSNRERGERRRKAAQSPSKRRGLTAAEIAQAFATALLEAGDINGAKVVDVRVSSVEIIRRERVRGLSILATFRWLCRGTTRGTVDCVIADIRRDVREMRAEGRGGMFIGGVVMWHTLATVLAVLRDGAARVARSVLPVLRVFDWLTPRR